jgi:chromosome segregation ATPase
MAEQNSLSPELIVLSKKLSQSQAEYDSLRSSMVQQVSHFRKLVKAIFDLDDGYFGGRFQSLEGNDGKTPQQDLVVALRVVEAISEELQGATAFADSPLLRDQVANLVSAIDELRTVSIETDRSATQALSFAGVTAAGATFPARTFPDNNPLACLTEAVGFLRDLQSLVGRLKDRVGALVLLAREADDARNEAEAATANVVESRSSERVSASLAAELSARDAELAALRSHSIKEQEAHGEEIRRIRGEIRDRLSEAHQALAREVDLHRSDIAEARGLVAEIEHLAAADPEAASSDDLDITLGVLRDALTAEDASSDPGSDAGLSALMAAADAVLMQWARLVNERAASAAKELSTLRWQLGETAARSEALLAEVADLKADNRRLHESEKGFTTAREAVAKELSTLRTQVAEQSRQLHGHELSLKACDEVAQRAKEHEQRLSDDLNKERSARTDERTRHQEALRLAQSAAQETVSQFEGVIQRARSAAEDAEKQLTEVRGQFATVRAEAEAARADTARAQAEVTRHSEALQQAQAREEQANKSREQAELGLSELRSKADAAHAEQVTQATQAVKLRSEIAGLQAALVAAEQSLAAAVAREQTAGEDRERITSDLRQRLEAAEQQLAVSQQQMLASQQHLLAIQKEHAAGQQQQAALEREVAALTAVSEALAGSEAKAAEVAVRLQQAEQASASATAECARLTGELQRVHSESQARERHASEADDERGRVHTLLSERDQRIAELALEAEQLRPAWRAAQTLADQTAAELTRLKTVHAGAVLARDTALADLAGKLTSEAAATAERDTVQAALVTAYAERDRLQSQSERQRVDLEAQAEAQRGREDEFGARLSDITRQLGDAKNVSETVQAENERLRAEIDKTAAQAERVETRSATEIRATAESAARAERKATESTKLLDSAVARAGKLESELAATKAELAELAVQLQQAQQGESNYADRVETEAAIGNANAARWTNERNELLALVKAAKLAVQNAKIARESDLQRIAELEGQLTIIGALKS